MASDQEFENELFFDGGTHADINRRDFEQRQFLDEMVEDLIQYGERKPYRDVIRAKIFDDKDK